MNFQDSKYKSTALTLDTYAPSTAIYGLSLFEKDLKEINDPTNQHFSSPPDRYSTEDDQPNPFSSRFKPDIRQRYIYRVLGSQEHQKLPSIKHQHVFIFDWDDTLLFTTYLKGKKITEFTEQTKKQLKQLDEIVCKILEYSINKGFVFIITNALGGWINYSSKVYLPEVHKKIIFTNKIMLFSARQLFEKIYPDDMKMWKVQTFRKLKYHLSTHVKNYLKSKILTNVICVGDQENDLEACKVLTSEFQLIYIKKIKLEQRPRPAQLIKQLKVLEKKMQQVFHAITNTTIKLQKRILTPQNIRKPSQEQSPQPKFQKQENK